MTTVAILSLHLPRVSWQRIAPALLVLPLVLYMLAFYLGPLDVRAALLSLVVGAAAACLYAALAGSLRRPGSRRASRAETEVILHLLRKRCAPFGSTAEYLDGLIEFSPDPPRDA